MNGPCPSVRGSYAALPRRRLAYFGGRGPTDSRTSVSIYTLSHRACLPTCFPSFFLGGRGRDHLARATHWRCLSVGLDILPFALPLSFPFHSLRVFSSWLARIIVPLLRTKEAVAGNIDLSSYSPPCSFFSNVDWRLVTLTNDVIYYTLELQFFYTKQACAFAWLYLSHMSVRLSIISRINYGVMVMLPRVPRAKNIKQFRTSVWSMRFLRLSLKK
jgi:hypothetical protein